MPLSEKTKTTISGANVVEEQICDFAYDPAGSPVYRLSNDEDTGVPKTSVDMTRLFMWEHGDQLYGTQAKERPGMEEYIKDINKAYGRESDYDHNMIFVFTEGTNELVSEQLEKLKN